MALERIPADIRAAGGVSRMSDPKMIRGIQDAVSIPVMAKCRIGHFVEAQILEAIEIDYIDESDCVIRPANFPPEAPGKGMTVLDLGRTQIAVINLMGNVYLDEHLACPFRTLDTLLKTPDLPKICIVDFHAEATGEKRAFGYYADGRVSAVFGTHTHVQTADETVLPKGTGYITDVGMTGPIESVLGVRAELVIKKQISKMPVRFDFADGPCKLDCILFDIDEKTGLTRSTERFSLR